MTKAKSKKKAEPVMPVGSPELICGAFKVHPVLKNYFGYCLKKAAHWMHARLNEELTAQYGMVTAEYGLLNVLEQTGAISQLELGASLSVDKATMVKLIDSLESRGFVKREVLKTDRRVKLVEITPAGRKIRKSLLTIAQKVEKEFLAPLNDQEVKMIKEIIPKLVVR